jgi:hypothetical protein
MKPDREEHGMGEQAEWERDRQEELAGVLPPNPWDDPQPLRLSTGTADQEEADWRQRDVPPQELALGVEKDPLGTTFQVVQARMAGARQSYAYGWWGLPSGSDWLAVGDWVMLPGNVVSPEGCKGRVESYGRNGYHGAVKDVSRRLPPQDIWLVQMEAVTGRAQALKVYRAAEKAGVSGERLAALKDVGAAALEKAGRL